MTDKRLTRILVLGLALVILAGAALSIAFAPDAQSVTRFVSIHLRGDADIDGDLDVDGTANLDAVDIDGALDMGNQTISNIGAAGTDFGSDGSLTTAAGITTTTGGVTVTAGGLTVTAGGATVTDGGLVVDDIVNIDDTDSTITGTQTLTPTASYYQMSPTTVLTLTLATGSANDGDLLIIHNLVSTSTTVVDTGATAGGGNITLGQDDLAGFIFGDSVWVELFSPDNS